MLLRTIAVENTAKEVLNGAVLCSFSVPQISRNFLGYSLNEDDEGGNSRVYIAMLQRNGEKYFLSSIDSEPEWKTAIQVFKQIVTHAVQGDSRDPENTDIPYHLIDLKDHKIPVARLMDHRSLTIKKNLVMRLITTTPSVEYLPAIENSLVVPAIRVSFSSVDTSQKPTLSPSMSPSTADADDAEREVKHESPAKSPSDEHAGEEGYADDLIPTLQEGSEPEIASSHSGEADESEVERDRQSESILPPVSLSAEDSGVRHELSELTTSTSQEPLTETATVDTGLLNAQQSGDLESGDSSDIATAETQAVRLHQGIQSTLAQLADVIQDLTPEGSETMATATEHGSLVQTSESFSSPEPVAQPQTNIMSSEVAEMPVDIAKSEENSHCSPVIGASKEAEYPDAAVEAGSTGSAVTGGSLASSGESPESACAFSDVVLQANDTEHLLFDVENTLSNLAGMAQELTQQKLSAIKQQEALDVLRAQQQERERQLAEKEEQLRQLQSQLQQERASLDKTADHNSRLIAERSAALQQLAESVEARERSVTRRSEVLQQEQLRLDEVATQQSLRAAELEKREVAIQHRNAELSERLKQLTSTKKKLGSIVKSFNETVTFNNSLHTISSTVLGDAE